jgi:hypothetical protein
MAATPVNISRVIEDDAIVKETIESTGGYRNNFEPFTRRPSRRCATALQRQMGTQILRGRTRDRPPLHPACVSAADLRRRFYFVDEHSNFDSD